jgi:hypothetical protein
MNRRRYLAAVIRLYLDQPGTPLRASRQDWAVAQSLFNRGVSLRDFTHTVHLATLRRLVRQGPPLPPVRSLAYYRSVLDQLTPDDLDPDYVRYIDHRYQSLLAPHTKARSDRQNHALSDRR